MVELAIYLPRSHREDIPALAGEFARRYGERFGKPDVRLLFVDRGALRRRMAGEVRPLDSTRRCSLWRSLAALPMHFVDKLRRLLRFRPTAAPASSARSHPFFSSYSSLRRLCALISTAPFGSLSVAKRQTPTGDGFSFANALPLASSFIKNFRR